MENTLAVKKINNFKLNFDPNSDSENKDYVYYKKLKIAKLDKYYKK